MTRGDEPAYPAPDALGDGPCGLTVREAAAIAAMQGILAHETTFTAVPFEDRIELAVRAADALLTKLDGDDERWAAMEDKLTDLQQTCNKHVDTNQRLRDEIVVLEKRIRDMGGET